MLSARPVVTVRARGHAAIRASHGKTIELTAADEITARATCVVGVATSPLRALEGLRGPVRVTLEAGGRTDHITAVANRRFTAGERAVVRRSAVRSPDTLAITADKAAADLDRGLVAALADPATEVQVTVAEIATSPAETALLLLASPAVAALGAAAERLPPELAHAGLVVADAAGARPAAAVAGRAGAGARSDGWLDEAWAALRRGDMVLLVCDLERLEPGVAAFVREVADAGVPVRTASGVDPLNATLAAAGLPGCPRALLGRPPRRRAERQRQFQALALLGATGVWAGAYRDLVPLVRELAARRGAARAALAPWAEDGGETVLVGSAGDVATRAPASARTDGVLVVEVGAAGGDAPAHVAVPDLVAGLVRADVPARTVAAALQDATGMPRRRAYDLVLEVKAGLDQS